MKIRVQEIAPTKTVVLHGSESWLQAIAVDLQTSPTPPPTLITGEINLRTDAAGFVYGKGLIKHTPILSCHRCDKDIPWPIEAYVDVSWRPAYESHAPRELTLTPEDLDVYFIESGTIDLEQLVIDTLQCALPDQIPTCSDETGECSVCGAELGSTLVYGEPTDEIRVSPFAVLKNLKPQA